MIRVTVYHNRKKEVCGFRICGHSDYAGEGSDIVCAAVSILAVNTVNCIEAFTGESIECDADEEKGGYLDFMLPALAAGGQCRDASLLLRTLEHGLMDVESEYGSYITIKNKEV